MTLGRTIITTAATMLTVLSLFFFTKDSMKDFALSLVHRHGFRHLLDDLYRQRLR